MAEIGGRGTPWASGAVRAIAKPVSRPLAAGNGPTESGPFNGCQL
jgi:hypothetical protein